MKRIAKNLSFFSYSKKKALYNKFSENLLLRTRNNKRKVSKFPHLFLSLTENHTALNEAKNLRLNTVQICDANYATFLADINFFMGASTTAVLFLLHMVIETLQEARSREKIYFSHSFYPKRKKTQNVTKSLTEKVKEKLNTNLTQNLKKKLKKQSLFHRKFIFTAKSKKKNKF